MRTRSQERVDLSIGNAVACMPVKNPLARAGGFKRIQGRGDAPDLRTRSQERVDLSMWSALLARLARRTRSQERVDLSLSLSICIKAAWNPLARAGGFKHQSPP